jgi:hypothetical protein
MFSLYRYVNAVFVYFSPACEEAYNTTEEENTCIFGCKSQVPQLKKFLLEEEVKN